MKLCKCGCGKLLVNERNNFIHGHNGQGHPKGMSAWNKGLTKDKDYRVNKISLALCNKGSICSLNGKKGGRQNKGKIRSIQFRERISALLKGRTWEDRYGEKRAVEIREKVSRTKSESLVGRNDFGGVRYRFKTGYFFSKKNNKNLFYRSSYELLAFSLLESMVLVTKFLVNPFRIPYSFNGVVYNYVPDLYVEYVDGQKQLIEVKANWELGDEKTREKLRAGRIFAISNGMKFDIWSEKEMAKDGKI